jgi:hypothetical protein
MSRPVKQQCVSEEIIPYLPHTVWYKYESANIFIVVVVVVVSSSIPEHICKNIFYVVTKLNRCHKHLQ